MVNEIRRVLVIPGALRAIRKTMRYSVLGVDEQSPITLDNILDIWKTNPLLRVWTKQELKAIYLHRIDRLQRNEIAVELGVTKGRVDQLLAKAEERFNELIDDFLTDEFIENLEGDERAKGIPELLMYCGKFGDRPR